MGDEVVRREKVRNRRDGKWLAGASGGRGQETGVEDELESGEVRCPAKRSY